LRFISSASLDAILLRLLAVGERRCGYPVASDDEYVMR